MTTTNPFQPGSSAVERADALLTRWGQRLSPADKPVPPDTAKPMPSETQGKAVQQADSLLGRMGHRMSGRGLVEAAAHVYVALAAKTGEMVDPIVKTWRQSVDQARRQQEQQTAQAQGTSGAHRKEADEKEGETALKKTAGAATEAAGTAA
jgi:hypothetical protein